MTGHDRLIADLTDLLHLARQFEFNDFRNSTFATPKVELVRRLDEIERNVKQGRYDNTPDDDPDLAKLRR